MRQVANAPLLSQGSLAHGTRNVPYMTLQQTRHWSMGSWYLNGKQQQCYVKEKKLSTKRSRVYLLRDIPLDVELMSVVVKVSR